MHRFSTCSRRILVAAIVLWVASAAGAAVNFQVTLLNPDGTNAQVFAAIPGFQAGHVNGEAAVWSSSPNNYSVINPAPAVIYGLSSTRQVGVVYSGGNEHASLWSGTPASQVDLHPAGWGRSFAYGVSGNQQVGHAVGGGVEHAFVWSGTAASAVDLNPAGYVVTLATGIANGKQVGRGATATTPTHALLWTGTAQSVVDLNPPGKVESEAWGTDGTHHVGWARAAGGFARATIWNSDNPANIIDLHNDTLFSSSRALGVGGGVQGGVGFTVGANPQEHAIAWFGSAASAVDLHTFLPNDKTWNYSTVTGVAADGTIVGRADSGGLQYAVIWTPLPEPSTFAVLALAGTVSLRRRHHRNP